MVVFDELLDHALEAYDRIIGLDLTDLALDVSLHKAPCGGEGTGKAPSTGQNWVGRGQWLQTRDGANRNDFKLL